MDLRELEAVIAIHERGSFSSAAASLFISQPALTRRVALLERELHIRIFVRSPKGVHLTQAGRVLLAPAQRALHETSEIRKVMSELQGGHRGVLQIIAAPSVNLNHIGRLIAEYHDRHPEAGVKITRSLSTSAALASVEAGNHDLAVVDSYPHAADMISAPIWAEDCLAIYSSPDGRRTSPNVVPVVTRELLNGRPMVLLATDSEAGLQTRRLWEMVGVVPPSTIETDQEELLVTLATHGRGIAVVPRTVAVRAYDDGAQIALPPQSISSSIRLARRRGPASQAIEQFLRIAALRQSALSAAG